MICGMGGLPLERPPVTGGRDAAPAIPPERNHATCTSISCATGETDWNIARRMQGHSDIPLNANGLRQARQAAAGMRGLPIDRILTSPLRRAKQTAQAVAAGRGVPVLIEENLIEMGVRRPGGQTASGLPGIPVHFLRPGALCSR